MADILQDLSPARLATAVEENMAAFLPVFGLLGRVCSDDPAGVKRSASDIPMALLNSVMDARLEADQADAAIQRIQADARARNVPVLWWIGPSTLPLDLAERLLGHGFTVDEKGPGMALDLARLKDSRPAPEGLSFHLVEDDASRRQWCSTMLTGFEAPPSAAFVLEAWHDLLSRADQETVLSYVGLLDGRPVATSLLFLAAGVAGIYSVATDPEARGKGIGSWMTRTAILKARSLGYRAGVLGASEKGIGVYRSLGFVECCRIDSYHWRAEAEQAR
jgi:ribosomal protein S18 acetylase RimI-like enzyme